MARQIVKQHNLQKSIMRFLKV